MPVTWWLWMRPRSRRPSQRSKRVAMRDRRVPAANPNENKRNLTGANGGNGERNLLFKFSIGTVPLWRPNRFRICDPRGTQPMALLIKPRDSRKFDERANATTRHTNTGKIQFLWLLCLLAAKNLCSILRPDRMNPINAPRILTTTVGSYPVPDWLAALPSEKALLAVTRVVFNLQRQAGIDLPTDGELYRFDANHPDTNGMIEYFVHKLGGVRREVGRSDTAAFRAKTEMRW